MFFFFKDYLVLRKVECVWLIFYIYFVWCDFFGWGGMCKLRLYLCDFWDGKIFDVKRNIFGLGGMCNGWVNLIFFFKFSYFFWFIVNKVVFYVKKEKLIDNDK